MTRQVVRVNALAFANLIRALLDGTMTRAEIVEYTGLHYNTVGDYLRELHRVGATHIVMWENNTRGQAVHPVYKLGRGSNVKQPRLTPSERQARCRAKKKALSDPRYFREMKNASPD